MKQSSEIRVVTCALSAAVVAWSCASPSVARDVRVVPTGAALGSVRLGPLGGEELALARSDAPAAPADPAAQPLSEATAPVPQSEVPVWQRVLEKLRAYGDFRLRHESSFELDDMDDRHRQRLRFRAGFNYMVTDEFTVGARVVTGDSDDPNSPHSTLGDVFNSDEISLDRAFLKYDPSWFDEISFTGGKFEHPFYRNPVYGEIVWDQDVQPEGGVVQWVAARDSALEGTGLTFGAYDVLEQGTGSDAFMLVAQGSGRLAFSDRSAATLACGVYHYSDPTPDASTAILGDNSGNATVDTDRDGRPDGFVSDFTVVNPIVAFETVLGELPVKVAGEYIVNPSAEIDEDQGFAAGVAVGSASRKGDVRAYYQWQVVEQDAIFSAFAGDDILLQTNHRSHVGGINYQLTDKIGLHVWALVSARDDVGNTPTTDSDSEQWRVRFDINVRL